VANFVARDSHDTGADWVNGRRAKAEGPHDAVQRTHNGPSGPLFQFAP